LQSRLPAYPAPFSFRSLNSAQREVVRHLRGPLLVLAGAGTGKTAVLTQRLVWLVREAGVKPQQILALTFTDKAADEMRARVDEALPLGAAGMWIGTFHAFGEYFLREEALEAGLDPQFRVISPAEVWMLLREHLFRLPLRHLRPAGNPVKYLQALAEFFARCQDELITPPVLERLIEELARKGKLRGEEFAKKKEMAATYRIYTQLKTEQGLLDYGDLLILCWQLLRRRHIHTRWNRQIRFILVDEYQDTNKAQHAILRALTKQHQNLMVCCDDDQAIYQWRGAALRTILEFKRFYPSARTVVLKQNYRSGQEILDAAYKLIQYNNPYRLEVKTGVEKRLRGRRNLQARVQHWQFSDDVHEAAAVAEAIRRLVARGEARYHQIAVLARTNARLAACLPALEARRIPTVQSGARGLFERAEVKDVLAYLNLLVNPADFLSCWRLLQLPEWNFAPPLLMTLYRRLRRLPREELLPWKLAELAPAKEREKLRRLTNLLTDHLRRLRQLTASQAVVEFLEYSGYLRRLVQEEEKNAEALLALNELVRYLRILERMRGLTQHHPLPLLTVVQYLQEAAEAGESPPGPQLPEDYDAVRLLTVHAAKGLEFDYVFLLAATADAFPARGRRTGFEIPGQEGARNREEHLREERRLFYVALTRARRAFIVTSAQYYEGSAAKQPSPFIAEAGIATHARRVLPGRQLRLPVRWAPAPSPLPPTVFPTTLSASQLETFCTCPWQYKLKFIFSLPTPPSAALSFGNTIHAVLRDYYLHLMRSGRKLALAELWQRLERYWHEEGYLSPAHAREMLRRGRRLLRAWHKVMQQKANLSPRLVEAPFRLKLGKHIFTGRIDLVEEIKPTRPLTVRVVDVKTGMLAKTPREASRDFQLALYALAVEKLYGWRVAEVVLDYVDLQRQVKVKKTPRWLAQARRELISLAQEIRKQQYPPRPQKFHCSQCPYRRVCDFAAV
jgi:DNA helicase-2/ATP-dependent DNA helicase PcrA